MWKMDHEDPSAPLAGPCPWRSKDRKMEGEKRAPKRWCFTEENAGEIVVEEAKIIEMLLT